MHTHSGKKAVFHYNGDCSGDVSIGCNGAVLDVPFADLADFVLGLFSEEMAQNLGDCLEQSARSVVDRLRAR